MTQRWSKAILIATGISLTLLFTGLAIAQKTKGKTRAAATKQLMKGIMQPNCAALGAALKGTAPADDAGWDLLAQQAACLNEMSYLLMDDGRCPDATWAGATKSLREGSATVLESLQKKDFDAANAAFKSTTTACGACHKAHKGT